MKFNLSTPIHTAEAKPMLRTALNKDYGDYPLTLAFAVAHVLSVATEDLSMVEHQAMQLAASEDASAREHAKKIRKEASDTKLRRGQLAIKIAEADPQQVDLDLDECAMILEVAGPRLLPMAYAQLLEVIN